MNDIRGTGSDRPLPIRDRVTALARSLGGMLQRLLVAVLPAHYEGRYRAALASSSELAQLPVPGRDDPIELRDVYVPLRLTELKWDELRFLGDPRGGRGRTGPAATMQDVLLRSPKIIVFGDPGSGKTTLLHRLGLMCVQDELALDYLHRLTFTHQDEAMEALVPLVVSCPRWADSGAEVEPYLIDVLADYGFPHAGGYLRRKLNKGQCLLLMDGLSDLAENEGRGRLLEQIEALMGRYERCNQVVFTSKPIGYVPELDEFAYYKLLPFDDRDVVALVEGWFVEQPARADSLLVTLEADPPMHAMARNPGLLTLLVSAYELHRQLSVRSVDLCALSTSILLGEGAEPDLRMCVQKLAHHMHRHRRSQVSLRELSGIVQDALVEIGRPSQDADQVVASLVEGTDLLQPVFDGAYEFPHAVLRDYLAAREIVEHGDPSVVVGHVGDSWWHSVIPLVAGLQGNAGALVDAILAQVGDDDEALLLAARCLHNADRPDEDLRRRIRSKLFLMFEKEEPALWSQAAFAIAGLEGKRARQAFDDLLRSERAELRASAARAIGRIGRAWGTTPLIAALGDREAQVRLEAAAALRVFGDRKALDPLVRRLDDDSPAVRQEVMATLGEIGEPALRPLVRALRVVPARAAEALVHLGPVAIPSLVDALASGRGEVREAAVTALAQIGPPAVQPLIAALEGPDPQVRCGAVAALGRIGDPEGVRHVVDALGDSEDMVRDQAASALAAIGVPAVRPLVDALIDENRAISDRAALLLEEIGAPAVDELLLALKHDRRVIRWAVAKVLGQMGASNPTVVPKLSELVEGATLEVRQSALRALARVGDKMAIDELVQALESDQEDVPEEAARQLLSLGGEKVVRGLRDAFDRDVARERIVELAGSMGSRAARDFLRDLLTSHDESVRNMAAFALETDERNGLYFYRLWEQSIEEYLLEHGKYTTALLRGTPDGLRSVILQRYVSNHPETALEYESETGILHLSAFSDAKTVIEYWTRASHNLGDEVELAGQMFAECVTMLTSELCDVLGVKMGKAESHGQFYCFDLDVSGVVRSTRLPNAIPLIFLRRETLWVSDLDQLRTLLVQTGVVHKTALLVLFSPEEEIHHARRLVDERLRDIHAVDVIVLGKRDIQHIVSAKEPQQALRFTICEQADLTLVSPYHFNEPAPPDLFFGREFEIRTITQAIPNSSVAVLGGRRIGKTSILNRVSDRLRETYCCHHMDCHPIRNYDTLYRTIAYRWPSVGNLTPEPVSFHSVVDGLRGNGTLILVLDEIDALLRFDMAHDELLFKTFRSLSQEGLCRFIFSGERMLSKQLKYGSKSPLFNFCGQRVELGYLDRRSARQLIVRPMGWMNIDLRDRERVVEAILDLSSCHPRLVQYICHRLIERINWEEVRFITPEHVERITHSNEFNEQYLYTVWGDATPFERALTLALEQVAVTQDDIRAALDRWDIPYTWESLKAALHDLEICSILERDNGTFRFVAEHFPRIARESLDVEMEIRAMRRKIRRE